MALQTEQEIDPGIIPGTSLRIHKYPSPALRAPNEDITEFSSEIKQLAKEMLLVMYASRGVGLAAPQVGVNKRLLVFNPEGSSKAWLQEIVLINPKIVGASKKMEMDLEACLSFPGMSGKVKRNDWIKIEAYKPSGRKVRVKYEGWKARIFQHEFDHLEGVVYIDRLDEEERKKVQPTLDQLIASYPNDDKAL